MGRVLRLMPYAQSEAGSGNRGIRFSQPFAVNHLPGDFVPSVSHISVSKYLETIFFKSGFYKQNRKICTI
jgi:hypothetical protein